MKRTENKSSPSSLVLTFRVYIGVEYYCYGTLEPLYFDFIFLFLENETRRIILRYMSIVYLLYYIHIIYLWLTYRY